MDFSTAFPCFRLEMLIRANDTSQPAARKRQKFSSTRAVPVDTRTGGMFGVTLGNGLSDGATTAGRSAEGTTGWTTGRAAGGPAGSTAG